MMMSNTVLSRISALCGVNATFAPIFKDMIIEEVCDLNAELTL